MIRIAIVDDDPVWIDQLQAFLHTYEQEQQQSFQIQIFEDGEDLIQQYQAHFDLIFLDIEMRFLDGMTTAKLIRETDPGVAILFITNMAQYAIRGYEVDAMDYMLKPVSYATFAQRMGRALGRLHHREQHFVSVPVRGGALKLPVEDILYVESQGHSLIYHTRTRDYLSTGTMGEAEKKLSDLGFFRANKGYLVNLEHVDGVQDQCAIVSGTLLPISRARKNAFMEAMLRQIGGEKP